MLNDEAILVAARSGGSKPPIFGIHVLGTDMRFYRPLAERLGPDQPVFGLWSGGTSGLTDHGDVVAVAHSYADGIERCRPEGPVTLAAVSLGGVVAFEVAHQLVARGRQVALLALFDAAGPHLDDAAPSAAELSAIHLDELRKGAAGYVEGRLRKVRANARRRVQIADLKARRATGREVDERLQRRELMEANVALHKAYDYRPYPGRVVVFKAGDDAFTRWQAESGMGWAPVVTGDLDVAMVPGRHLSMLDEPHVETLAQKLASAHAAAVESLRS